jgi:hypothetical protein
MSVLTRNGKLFYPTAYVRRLKSYPVKHCAHCGKQLFPIPYVSALEGLGTFKKRQHCSTQCYHARRLGENPTAPRSGRQRADYLLKPCKQCGRDIPPPVNKKGHREGPATYERRKYCSHACKGVANRKALPEKTCAVCGVKLERLLVSRKGRSETSREFLQRKTCGIACQGKLMQSKLKGKPMPKQARAKPDAIPESKPKPVKAITAPEATPGVKTPRKTPGVPRKTPGAMESVESASMESAELSPVKSVKSDKSVDKPVREFTGFPTPRELQKPTESVRVEPVNVRTCDVCGENDVTTFGCRDCKRREAWRAGQRTHHVPRAKGGNL